MLSPADAAQDLLDFIWAAPSPYHAVDVVAGRLAAAGFRRLEETEPWPASAGRSFVVRGGSLVAWATEGDGVDPLVGFRVVGAHTDSPNLRVKPNPDTGSVGWAQVGVEPYGGILRTSWLNRDLGLSGRVAVRGRGPTPDLRLVRDDRALLTIPQLAIHLDRAANDGLTLNPQHHLVPVWGVDGDEAADLVAWAADAAGAERHDVLAWDLMVHDVLPGAFVGPDRSLLATGRIDNLLSCWAATGALLDGLAAGSGAAHVPLICLFDHEEVGSETASGAGSPLLATVLERIVVAEGGDRDAFHRSMAASMCVSADGAHATHPNYPERHEPDHQIEVNAGPVLKVNNNARYASDALGAAVLELAADVAGVGLQRFVVRSDMACGSTIGPITAGRLGITTVDCGAPQLSMHAARELCGADDPDQLRRLLAAFLHG